MADMEKFIALFDLHYGYERRNGHKVALHDTKALKVALDFAKDFKPDHVILGGDMLDCGCVSHHNHGKPGSIEGLKLLGDAKELREALIKPIEALRPKTQTYITGNHEDWLNDLQEMIPALEGIIDVKSMLKLDDKWKVVPVGEAHRLGKLVFVHGDQIKGGVHSAKYAVEAYHKNIYFGHHHTHQAYTRVSSLEQNGHTGTAVPCLCKKNPEYGGGSPNRWMQGFLFGYINNDQTFNSYVVVIIDGKATINGKLYKA
jgi:metallophosphoesterase superfamily enzyme